MNLMAMILVVMMQKMMMTKVIMSFLQLIEEDMSTIMPTHISIACCGGG